MKTHRLIGAALLTFAFGLATVFPYDEDGDKEPTRDLPGTTLIGCTKDHHMILFPVVLRMTTSSFDKFGARSFSMRDYTIGLNRIFLDATTRFTAKDFSGPQAVANTTLRSQIDTYNDTIRIAHGIVISAPQDPAIPMSISPAPDADCKNRPSTEPPETGFPPDRIVPRKEIPPVQMPQPILPLRKHTITT